MSVEEAAAPALGYLDLADLRQPLDREALFGRKAPLEVEIGTGRGDFLFGYAGSRPDHDFLGVERKLVYLRRAVNKISRSEIANVRLLNVEARNLLANYFEPSSLRAVHIYFPDPWPKKRHGSRRIVTSQLASAVASLLEPGGFLHLRTDHAEYFERMVEAVAGEPRLHPIDPPEEVTAVATGFETRYLVHGRPIWRASYKVTKND